MNFEIEADEEVNGIHRHTVHREDFIDEGQGHKEPQVVPVEEPEPLPEPSPSLKDRIVAVWHGLTLHISPLFRAVSSRSKDAIELTEKTVEQGIGRATESAKQLGGKVTQLEHNVLLPVFGINFIQAEDLLKRTGHKMDSFVHDVMSPRAKPPVPIAERVRRVHSNRTSPLVIETFKREIDRSRLLPALSHNETLLPVTATYASLYSLMFLYYLKYQTPFDINSRKSWKQRKKTRVFYGDASLEIYGEMQKIGDVPSTPSSTSPHSSSPASAGTPKRSMVMIRPYRKLQKLVDKTSIVATYSPIFSALFAILEMNGANRLGLHFVGALTIVLLYFRTASHAYEIGLGPESIVAQNGLMYVFW